MDNRRKSDSGHHMPAMQVVGFHVEGQSPSPNPASILQDSMRKITAGSPTPVIIPPSFQRTESQSRQPDAAAAARSLALEFAGGSKPAGAVATESGLVSRTTSSIQQQTPTPVLESHSSEPITSTAASASNVLRATVSAMPTASTAAQQQPSAAEQRSAAASTAAVTAPASQQAPTTSQRTASTVATADQQQPPAAKPKAATRAERRAQQEAERAAKAAAKAAQSGGRPPATSSAAGGGAAAAGGSDARSSRVSPDIGRPPKQHNNNAAGAGERPARPPASPSAAPAESSSGKDSQQQAVARPGVKSKGGPMVSKSTELFAHLQQYKRVTVESVLLAKEGFNVHPAILALGLRYADGSIKGSNARCMAMLNALSKVIADYSTPEGKSLSRDLMAQLNAAVDFLVRCRPLSVSMGNAIKFLKLRISKIDPSAPEDEAKSELLQVITDYINEKILMADKVLVDYAVTKVYDDDVILTYAYSHVVLEVLLTAHNKGKRFRVVVVDSRPELEGRQLLRRLLQADIACTYVHLSGLSYIMREVTKVMLGASAVLSNGTVMSRAGSAAVAMTAAASSTPVLICCETYKFHERVQLDSITHNELGDPDALALLPPASKPATGNDDGLRSSALVGWAERPRLGLLNLKYDAMPADYVTMVVTEFGMIPPTSVPVILREYSESAKEGA
eukprot:jgi/Chrzof1/11761/Cz06g09010.t1